MNDFKILLQAVLDANSINQSDIDKIQKVISKYHLNLTADLDKASVIAEIKKIVPQLEAELKKMTGVDIQINDSALLKAFNQIEKQAESTAQKVNKIQHSWSDGSYEAKYDSLIAKTRQWVDANDESVISTQKLTQAYNEFNTAASNFAKDGSVKNRDILIQKEEELGRQLKATTNDIKVQNAEWAKSSNVDSLHQKIQEFYDKNSASHRTWGASLKNMLNETSAGAQITRTRLDEIEKEFLQIGNSARQAGKLGMSFFDGVKAQVSKFTQWISVTGMVMRGIQIGKGMLADIKELDTALVDLQKTTDATAQQLENFYYTSNETAKRLGATTEEVINAASAWSRLGYSIKDAQKMAENSSIFASISPEMDIDTATDGLVSMMKAFDIDAEESLDGIISKVNAIGNSFAVSNDMIVEAMKRSSSAMASANNSLEETIAMNTASTEITQNAEVTSNALRTMSMRIRGRQTLPPYTVMYMLCA